MLGYKIVTIGLNENDFSDNPVVLVMTIPEEATIIKCTPYYPRTYRTDKVIPKGYYLPKLNINETINYLGNAQYEYIADITQYRDDYYFNRFNIDAHPVFRSRYCYLYDKKPLIYRLDSLLEIDINELDTDETNTCSSGINYFHSYHDAILFLNYNS